MERLKVLFNSINKHEVFTLAGSLAYTIALALAPRNAPRSRTA